MPRWIPAWAAAMMLAGAAAPCAAQEHAEPTTPERRPAPPEDPDLDNPRLEEDAKALQKQGPGDDSRVRPTADQADEPSQPGLPGPLEALPGLEGTDYLLRTPVIRSEGVFLTMQRGTVLRGKGGEWWFVFHRGADGHTERPMILIPCQTLERMVAGVEGDARPVFRATGQVFVYYGRNYFLPTTALLAAGADGGADAALIGPPAPTDGEPSTTPDDQADPSLEDLIGELSGNAEQPRALDGQAGGSAAVEGTENAAGAIEAATEGKIMSRRRGRMIRQSAAWAFAFDNDVDSAATVERPMVLVPCLNLETMEKIAAKQGDAVVFELSGRVLAYRGRNYIVPTMFQVVRDREVRPLQ